MNGPPEALQMNMMNVAPELPPPSDRIFTIPTTLMTVPRFILGVVIPIKVALGRNTTVETALGVISDAESKPADLVDRLLPNAGLGRSIFGGEADYMADGSFGVGSTLAAIISKKSSPLARISAGITAVKIGRQAKWALGANKEHKAKTGERLKSKVGFYGKAGTVAMLGSTLLNTIDRDVKAVTPEQKRWRFRRGIGSTVLAAAGLLLGEKATSIHDRNFRAKMDALDNTAR